MLHFAGLSGGRYELEVRWPGPPTTATVLDGSVNTLLADLDPSTFPDRILRIYRNGIVEWGKPAGAARGRCVPHLPAREAARAALADAGKVQRSLSAVEGRAGECGADDPRPVRTTGSRAADPAGRGHGADLGPAGTIRVSRSPAVSTSRA
jgi:hypothetical protein